MPSLSQASRFLSLRPRRFQAYCVGAPKTGTTSLAASFSEAYRAWHEPRVVKTNGMVIDHLKGDVSTEEIRRFLLWRDRLMRLELESNHVLAYVVEHLVELFPESRYVVTIREPLSWLKSRLNHHYRKPAKDWNGYREYFWADGYQDYPDEERILEEIGLCTLDTYLAQYADHYERVLGAVPPERRMVVATQDIDARIGEVASFVGADPAKVIVERSNTSAAKTGHIKKIPDAYYREKIKEHCLPLIEAFFPQTLDRYAG